MEALMKMCRGDSNLYYMTDVPEPVPGPHDLKIRVHACGICGTDLHIRHDDYLVYPPVIIGHEYSGVVAATGAEVKNFAVGDPVVSLTTARTCEECDFCLQGRRMLCPGRRSIGSGVNGAFASYVIVPAALAFHVPASVSLDAAVLCEPLACVVRAVIERTNVRAGDRVFVSGAGAIGLLAALAAIACGGVVTMSGLSSDVDRLAFARQMGVHAVVDVQKELPEAIVARLTDKKGFDVAFECSGAAASADNCLTVLRKTGQYTQIGLFGKAVPFNFDLALTKEIHIVCSFASERASWQKTLRLLEYGMPQVEALITHKIPLRNWGEAFALYESRQGFKILLIPDPGTD